MGRATQGVTLISLDEGTKLSGLQHIAEAEAEVELDADVEDDASGSTETGDEKNDDNGDAV
jgi:DNA gyrase subunit A